MIRRWRFIATLLLPVLALGCREAANSNGESGAPSPKMTAIDPANAGVISGTVHFTGKPPERLQIDMAQDPACSITAKEPNFAEQYVIHDGKLQNVYVYVKDGLGNKVYAAPSTPVILDQKACRYVPHVIAAMVGQPVEFRNSDPTMHNVHLIPTTVGNEALDISQGPMGAPVTKAFKSPEEMLPVRCNNHPWMNAFINIAPSPFFAISDADGHFDIRGVPPGTYTVVAVQEKMGDKTAQVTVAPQQTATADFTFQQ